MHIWLRTQIAWMHALQTSKKLNRSSKLTHFSRRTIHYLSRMTLRNALIIAFGAVTSISVLTSLESMPTGSFSNSRMTMHSNLISFANYYGLEMRLKVSERHPLIFLLHTSTTWKKRKSTSFDTNQVSCYNRPARLEARSRRNPVQNHLAKNQYLRSHGLYGVGFCGNSTAPRRPSSNKLHNDKKTI